MIPDGIVIGALCMFFGFMFGAYFSIWLTSVAKESDNETDKD